MPATPASACESFCASSNGTWNDEFLLPATITPLRDFSSGLVKVMSSYYSYQSSMQGVPVVMYSVSVRAGDCIISHDSRSYGDAVNVSTLETATPVLRISWCCLNGLRASCQLNRPANFFRQTPRPMPLLTTQGVRMDCAGRLFSFDRI